MNKEDYIEAEANTVETQAEETIGSAVKEGVEAGRKSALNLIPNVGEALSKTVYGSCYAASYAVTFAAVAVTKMLPLDNVVGRAVHDGAHDAIVSLEKTESKQDQIKDVTPEASAA